MRKWTVGAIRKSFNPLVPDTRLWTQLAPSTMASVRMLPEKRTEFLKRAAIEDYQCRFKKRLWSIIRYAPQGEDSDRKSARYALFWGIRKESILCEKDALGYSPHWMTLHRKYLAMKEIVPDRFEMRDLEKWGPTSEEVRQSKIVGRLLDGTIKSGFPIEMSEEDWPGVKNEIKATEAKRLLALQKARLFKKRRR